MTQNVFCPSVILSRNEQRPPCRKRPGPWWFHWPHHTQEGTTQVQAEADPHIQEQGPQARPEGVKKKNNLYTYQCLEQPNDHTPGADHSPLRLFFPSFGDDIPGMEGLGTDITVVCPWEAFGDMELSDLAKYGII